MESCNCIPEERVNDRVSNSKSLLRLCRPFLVSIYRVGEGKEEGQALGVQQKFCGYEIKP